LGKGRLYRIGNAAAQAPAEGLIQAVIRI